MSPSYDVICTSCKHEFEIEKSYKDNKKIRCPKCKGFKVRKRITIVPAISFHGDGFTKSIQRLTDE